MKKLFNEATWNALRPVLIWTLFVLIPFGVFAWLDYPIGNWILDHAWIKWTCVWVLFAIFSGWAEAFLIHTLVKLGYDIPGAIHSLFNILRSFVWVPIAQLTSWPTAFCLVGVFIFCHDFKYYQHRNKLNPNVYKERGWSDPSDTSKAFWDKVLFNWVRIVLLVIGTAGLVYFNRTNLW